MKEANKSQRISAHHNLFRYSIDTYGKHQGKDIIDLSDLWIGITGGKDFVLYSESLEKQIIPVVQHPLNPIHTSNPISRILWHIAQQDVVRFVPLYPTSFRDTRYSP